MGTTSRLGERTEGIPNLVCVITTGIICRAFPANQDANFAVPPIAGQGRPKSRLLKTVDTSPDYIPNENVQGGEVETVVKSPAWCSWKGPSDSKAFHPLGASHTIVTTILASVFRQTIAPNIGAGLTIET
ncbi:hypothetical protein J6590_084763 [Homalodisca vitripennis]|nr:hypothetical protein J6590_084763 [Homalodisca vitripennis]